MFFCIADSDTLIGFKYAGVDGVAVDTPEETRAAFREACLNPDNSIIIITQRLASFIEDEIKEQIAKSVYPVIVEIPDIIGEFKEGKRLIDIIREAIGVSV